MNSLFISPKEQIDILTRGVVNFEVESELKNKLLKSQKEGKPLLIKAGFDPTAPDLHLGHSVLLTKMRAFQNLGHNVSFLIGDFTAKIGDPTGKNITRPELSNDEIIANSSTYKRQAFKILNPKKTFIKFNSEWLGIINFADIIKISSKYSLSRMIERDDFAKRISNGWHIGIHELLYPLAQGYDSVVINPDIEIGGTDQLFNLLVGRNLMRYYGLIPQCIMTVPLLEGIDAREINGKIVGNKMSKSLNNHISLEESASSQFGKLMSICDPLMWRYYDLLSLKSNKEINDLKKCHPKKVKEILAFEIVSRYHGKILATAALKQFYNIFGSGNRNKIPNNSPIIHITSDKGELSVLQALVISKLSNSHSSAKRLIRQGGISINGIRITDIKYLLHFGTYAVRAGKKRWSYIVVE